MLHVCSSSPGNVEEVLLLVILQGGRSDASGWLQVDDAPLYVDEASSPVELCPLIRRWLEALLGRAEGA